MKRKVSELEAANLDAAVAQALGWQLREDGYWMQTREFEGGGVSRHPIFGLEQWKPSSMWEFGGPIIERERIQIEPPIEDAFMGAETGWNAYVFSGEPPYRSSRGQTPLIAAMRAYVASKCGDEVEL